VDAEENAAPPTAVARILGPTLDAWNPVNMAKGAYKLLLASLSPAHQQQLISELAMASAGEAVKAEDAFKAGHTGAGIGHALGTIPIVGRPFSALAEGDVPSAIGETLALASQVAGPKGAGAVTARIAPKIRASAETSMVKALGRPGSAGPATEAALRTAKEVAPRLTREGFGAMSATGAAEKAATALEKANVVLDQALAQVPPNRALASGPIRNTLDRLKEQYFVQGTRGKVPISGAEGEIAQIEAMQKTLEGAGDFIPFEEMRNLRQKWDRLGKWQAANTTSQNVTAELYRSAANMLRKSIARDQPQVAAANKDFSFWSDVAEITEKSALRPGQSNAIGTMGWAQILHGLRSNAARYASAGAKHKLASLLEAGNTQGALTMLTAIGAIERAKDAPAAPVLVAKK
jgi:hypothetical protein